MLFVKIYSIVYISILVSQCIPFETISLYYTAYSFLNVGSDMSQKIEKIKSGK